MLWEHYVFRRGSDANELWEQMFNDRSRSLLYIAGSGFDLRAQKVMGEFVASMQSSCADLIEAKLVLIDFANYRLDASLDEITKQNERQLVEIFTQIGSVESVSIGSANDTEELSASSALRKGIEEVLKKVNNQTDIVLDVSSLPRVIYLGLMTSLLDRLIPNKAAPNALSYSNVNFQILVAEDAELDSHITAEDPSSEIVLVPGFSSAMQVESVQDWPLVWFPILGEHRVAQLNQLARSASIPGDAEVCPVLPHPSRNPRRADRLLVEYKEPLFDTRHTPTSNILYVHESQPFEVYRQLFGAMDRYRKSMAILGGCRLVVTPCGSKLITLGAGLACFEIRPSDLEKYGIAIPHAEPTRYLAEPDALKKSQPDICSLLLTGEAYA